MHTLPTEILVMIEDAVDKEIRCYRPPAGSIFRRVKGRCRREGWALNRVEEHQLAAVAIDYVRALRPRSRTRRILEGHR
jgi:hypothetical protein